MITYLRAELYRNGKLVGATKIGEHRHLAAKFERPLECKAGDTLVLIYEQSTPLHLIAFDGTVDGIGPAINPLRDPEERS